METLEFFAILMIAIMYWAFCTSHLFMCMCDDDDYSFFYKLCIFVYSMIMGWIIVPIKLGIELYEKL